MDDFNQIIQDAEDNFQNGRFQDAFAHFSSISQKYLGQGKIDESMYYGYRSILCLQLLEESFTKWKEIGILGLNFLKISLKNLGLLLDDEKDPRRMKRILQLQLNLVENSNFSTYIDRIIELILTTINTILEEVNLPNSTKISLLQEAIQVSSKSKSTPPDPQIEKRLVKNLLEEAATLPDDEIRIFSKIQLLREAIDYTNDDELIVTIETEIERLERIINEKDY